MSGYYNVNPRYAGGSPAQVDEATAIKVAKEEKAAYDLTVEGVFGEENRKRALEWGTIGISELVVERADAWIVTDLITGDRFVRPFPGRGLESPMKRESRHYRLSSKYGLPLESTVRQIHVDQINGRGK